MSDYLQQIAARSLNRTPTVRPRLAARFEPSGITGAEATYDRNEPALSVESLVASESTPQETSKPVSQQTDTRAIFPSTQQTIENLQASLPSIAADPFPNPSSISARERPSTDSTGKSIHRSTNKLSKEVRPISTASFLSEDSPLFSTAAPSHQNQATDALPAHETILKPRADNLSGSRAPLSTDARRADLATPPVSSLRPNLSERIHPLSSRQSSSALVPAIPAATSSTPSPASVTFQPPPIQVTIGRIEVRAVPPKQPLPKSPSPRPSRPSLEEYLRDRRGRKPSRSGG